MVNTHLIPEQSWYDVGLGSSASSPLSVCAYFGEKSKEESVSLENHPAGVPFRMKKDHYPSWRHSVERMFANGVGTD